MKGALLSFRTESQPCPICGANVIEIEALPLLLVWSGRPDGTLVADLGVVVAHLGIFLDTERVLLIPTDRESRLVHWNHSVAGWTLKHVQFAHRRL